MRVRHFGETGLTLLEILVALGVVAILTAIIIPLRRRVVFFQAFYHVARPPMSLRQPLPAHEQLPSGIVRPTWVERTPAMAAELTDHVWTCRECLTAKCAPLHHQSMSR